MRNHFYKAAGLFLLIALSSFITRHIVERYSHNGVTKEDFFADDDPFIVKTRAGLVSGVANPEADVHIYKGIPFAAPPVGALRWKAPQPVHPWKGVRACDTFAASPMQGKPVPFIMYTSEFLIPERPISEDCLYLNVWTGVRPGSPKKPVIVFIPGGGFVAGSGSCPIYDGEQMAKKGVVFVTINYRLGVFGFLAHPDLSKESPDHVSGNYAILDQIAALQWVHQNIAAFGGDPGNVTVAGQSAGAFSVNTLMCSPLAKGLFHRVIAESGGLFSAGGRFFELAAAEQVGLKWAQSLQAGSADALRAMPAEELLKHQGSFPSHIVIDGHVLPAPGYSIFENGGQNDVPVLTGWNGDDGFPSATTPSPEQYRDETIKQYGDWAPAFLKAFPGDSLPQVRRSQMALLRDNLFAWQNYTWAKLETTKGQHEAYLYIFKRVPPGDEQYGAFHTAEVPYAYHSLSHWNRQWTDADRKLEELMSSYWVNFATNGNPNADGLPAWRKFDPGSNSIMTLDGSGGSMQPIAAEAELNFMDRYQAELRTINGWNDKK